MIFIFLAAALVLLAAAPPLIIGHVFGRLMSRIYGRAKRP